MADEQMEEGLLAGGAADAQRETPTGEPSNVTPEEQESYDKVVMAAETIIFDGEQSGRLVKMLQGGAGNPGEAIGDVTVMLITQMDEQAGGKIPEEVVIPAAFEIMSDVIELGEAAGVLDMNTDADYVSAWQATMGNVLMAYGASQEEIEQLMAEHESSDVMGEAVNAQFQVHANDGTPTARTSRRPEEEASGMPPMPPEGGGML